MDRRPGRVLQPTATARETAGITTRLIVTHVRRVGGQQAVERLLALAGVGHLADDLESERNWFTYDVKLRLLDAAVTVTGDPAVGRRIGELVADDRIAAPVKVVLSVVGSPGRVVKRVAQATHKFSTVSSMETLELSRSRATLAFRLDEPYRQTRPNCDYNIGLLSQVPVLFGLPPATVEHAVCMVDGADSCRYRLRWRNRARFWHRFRSRARRRSDAEAGAVWEQLRDLQSTVTDLVSADEVDDVLARIAARASTAVRAPRYLLAVELDGDAEPRVMADGIPVEQARVWGRALVDGGRLELGEAAVMSSRIRSSRRTYGTLAALFPAGMDFFPEERELLDVYARLAAAALDSATALAVARSRGRTAEVLFALAADLATVHTAGQAGEVAMAALPELLAADRASLFLLDPGGERLTLAAASDAWTPDQLTQLAAFRIGRDDTPLVDEVVRSRRPEVFTDRHPDPFVTDACRRFGSGVVVAIPVVSADEVLGVVFASWADGDAAPALDGAFFARADGLASQLAAALARAALIERTRHEALHDALTSLPNRSLFEDRLQHALDARHRSGRGFALLFVDLDRFKAVNDSLGHAAGDHVLVEAARRLRAVVRQVDTVARMGGDEFTILLDDVRESTDVERVASQVVAAFAEPFRVADRTVYVTASVGLALPADDDRDAEALLLRADGAMYDAKLSGRNGWSCSTSTIDDPLERISMIGDLRSAIGHGELELYYQPQLTVDGDVTGVEALLRWNHPTRGLVTPGVFLPIAEEAGLQDALDMAVVRMAVQQGARWLQQGHPPLRIAVNISARTVCETAFLTTVSSALAATRFPAELLEFELTEHQQFPDLERARVITGALVEMGCGLAIDDVGRGYSSLNWLQHLPVRRMKLDRSFVSDVARRAAAADLTSGLIALGHRLGCTVVAEGVEEEAQLRFLREHHCDEVQGFLFSPALPATELPRWLRDRGGLAAA